MNQLLFPVIVSLFSDLHIKQETGSDTLFGVSPKVGKKPIKAEIPRVSKLLNSHESRSLITVTCRKIKVCRKTLRWCKINYHQTFHHQQRVLALLFRTNL